MWRQGGSCEKRCGKLSKQGEKLLADVTVQTKGKCIEFVKLMEQLQRLTAKF